VAKPPAPLVNVCCAGVCHRPEPFKPSAQKLQLAALAKAEHEALTVDCYDSFQHSCHGFCQRAEDPFGRREQALQLGDGGRSLLALDAD
jgi:hypothetical protein